MSTTYGYIRMSTKDQNEARQLIAMHGFPVEDKHIYVDKQSGKDLNRPQYFKLIRRLRAGDTLVIKSIGRLGRNYDEITEQWRILSKEKHVYLVVLDMPLLNTRKDAILQAHSLRILSCNCCPMWRRPSVSIFGADKLKASQQQRHAVFDLVQAQLSVLNPLIVFIVNGKTAFFLQDKLVDNLASRILLFCAGSHREKNIEFCKKR